MDESMCKIRPHEERRLEHVISRHREGKIAEVSRLRRVVLKGVLFLDKEMAAA